MEKNRIRPIKSGKSSRMSYSRQKEVLQMPNLIEVQKDSYQWFLAGTAWREAGRIFCAYTQKRDRKGAGAVLGSDEPVLW